jgi:DNA-directed RNA polymerase subunit K/omega
MRGDSSSKLFTLYRILSVVLDLRTFSEKEVKSLAGVAAIEVEKFMERNVAKGFLRWDNSRRLTMSSRGFENFTGEALGTARELLRIAVRQHLESPKRGKSIEHRKRASVPLGSRFRDAMLIAARTEALVRGAVPKVYLKKAKPSRIAIEEFRQGILTEEDLRPPIPEPKPEDEEQKLYFEFGDDEIGGSEGYTAIN